MYRDVPGAHPSNVKEYDWNAGVLLQALLRLDILLHAMQQAKHTSFTDSTAA